MAKKEEIEQVFQNYEHFVFLQSTDKRAKMIKIEREVLSKKITAIAKCHKYLWQMLKEQIIDYGYQDYYPAQDFFANPIDLLVTTLDESEKKILIDAWKKQLQRTQFATDEEYLNQYKLFVMEELVNRATKAAYC